MNQIAHSQSNCSGEIVVINCGSQTAQLIVNELRLRVGVQARMMAADTKPNQIRGAAGIIISGSPSSVYAIGAPQPDTGLLDMGVPVLGICYGMHVIALLRRGKVCRGASGEFGRMRIQLLQSSGHRLFDETDTELAVWMSHGDHVSRLPENFEVTARSANCDIAAFAHREQPLFGVQFHPEVKHTEHGKAMLQRFAHLCAADPYPMDMYLTHIIGQISMEAGERSVLMLLSGGVDSTVAFMLLTKALGADRVQGLLIDTGLMRANEADTIMQTYAALGLANVAVYEASDLFFNNLRHKIDPEEKRKAVGESFVHAYGQYAQANHLTVNDGWLLGQGTLYPDWIESGTERGSDHIKLHHNMHSKVAHMRQKGEVIEPLKELYKDEVRRIGNLLGLPSHIVEREPFPGPGLAVRTLCSARGERHPLLNKLVRYFTWPSISAEHTILPIKSVGVQGDERSYAHVVALFIGFGNFHRLDWYATEVAPLITNRVRQVNRVVACLSHDRPVTFYLSQQFLVRKRIELARHADAIVQSRTKLVPGIWQFPVVLLPCGAQPGQQGIILRPVESTNAMTAEPHILKAPLLKNITDELLALEGVDCVFYDITNKPPGTIEWE